MSRRSWLAALLAPAMLLATGLAGCGAGGAPEGDLPATKPITDEQSAKIKAQVEEGMRNSGYKGAPNRPAPK